MLDETPSTPGTHSRGGTGAHLLAYALLAGLLVTTLCPVVWMVSGSLKSDAEFYTNIWGLPAAPVWSNYREAWATGGIGRAFVNSVIVTGGAVSIVLALASLAAYAFATSRFPGSTALFYFFLLSLMIPQGVLALPIFTVVSQLGLANTRISMVLVYSAGYMGFGIFILRAYLSAIPRELRDAALIDGCSPFGAYWRVVLPLARPALAAVAIFTGLGTWNEYFLGSLLVRSRELRTLPVGLAGFVQRYTTHYPQYFAALVMMTIPVVVLYVLGQRQFQSGLTAGALRG
ncbi:MAG TPA: carbohydrate ABC transporter permease [Roseiflexaceae bacterium]